MAEIRHILGRGGVQPKLKIGSPNDAREQEADRVAEEVMRMEASDMGPATLMHGSPPAVQRGCDGCGAEQTTHVTAELIQRKAEEDEEELLQPKRYPGQRAEATPIPGLGRPMLKSGCACGGGCSSCRAPSVTPVDVRLEREADQLADRIVREAAPARALPLTSVSASSTAAQADRGDGEEHAGEPALADLPWLRAAVAGGEPLSPELRGFYEPRFGRDLSGVRIHTGQRADAASRAINARAFTLGRDIAFARGEYRPGTSDGRRLLAHELAHVGQQGADKQIRRAVACGEECPDRVAGEVTRSGGSAMLATELRYPPGGYLVWDFSVGSSSVKADLAGNSDWTDIVNLLAGASGFRFEILGFSDCEGGTERNESLRRERAAALYAALPPLAQGRISRFAGAPINDCLTGNRTESDRRLNRSAWVHLVEQTIEMDPEAIEGETQPVYICTKPLDTSPYGNHAFFRIGSDRTGSPTISLQPSDFVPGVTRTTCIQGEKGRDYPSDVNASGTCFLSSVSHACLERNYAAYPKGHYCTWGPNSNTFVGYIARACGETREPSDPVPGWDDSPPPAGTYAPNRYVTLAGCSTIFCREGEEGELEPYLPRDFEPRYLGGGAYMDERGIVWQGPGPKI